VLFRRRTLVLIGVGFLTLALIAGSSLWLVSDTRRYSAEILQNRLVRAALVRVVALLQRAESGQRGFLLTEEPAYLESYSQPASELPRQMQELAGLVTSDPSLRAKHEALGRLVGSKLEELARTVELTRAGQREQALALVRTDRGRDLMEETRTIAAAAVSEVDGRLSAASDALARSGTILLVVTSLGLLVILVVAGGSVLMLARYTRELEQARLTVEELNAGLEERVRERTADLEAANEEVQRFAYIVSHDLRAPLVNVMGFTSELEVGQAAVGTLVNSVEERAPDLLTADARTAVREDMPEAIGFIRSSTTRMDRLINAILKLSREGRRALHPERVRMEDLFQGLAASVQHQLAAAGAELRIETPIPDVVSDRLALEQVFGNLVDNAVKYLDPARPGMVQITGSANGRRVVYEVADNGRGIDPKDHERIFELFRRSGAQDRPGEGIGLAHVRALVRRLGGSIACRSEPGRGSAFRIDRRVPSKPCKGRPHREQRSPGRHHRHDRGR
jgi:signal transduction histidine kinase